MQRMLRSTRKVQGWRGRSSILPWKPTEPTTCAAGCKVHGSGPEDAGQAQALRWLPMTVGARAAVRQHRPWARESPAQGQHDVPGAGLLVGLAGAWGRA